MCCCSCSPSSGGGCAITARVPTTAPVGAAFVLGDAVKGGQYGEYPSRKPADLTQGDLAPTLDFRGVYATILEDWLHVDAQPIVKGTFEKPRFLS